MFRTLHFEKNPHFREDLSFISGLAEGAEDKEGMEKYTEI